MTVQSNTKQLMWSVLNTWKYDSPEGTLLSLDKWSNKHLNLRPGILDTTSGQWFSADTPVSSTNKTDRHDITLALNIIKMIIYRLLGYKKPLKHSSFGRIFHELLTLFSCVRVAQSLVFCVVFCRILFVLLFGFHFVFVLFVLLRYGFWLAPWYFQTFHVFLVSEQSIYDHFNYI
jgi:hypothetical protein